MNWLILTGEYAPDPGGVADYTRNVAEILAARGEAVTVLCPAGRDHPAGKEQVNGVQVIRLPGMFGGRGQLQLARCLRAAPAGERLLIQYVPHAFGWRAMNLPLFFWLSRQRRHRLWTMFHEVAAPVEPGQPWRHRLLAEVTRRMARMVAAASDRIMISTDAWRPRLQSICGRSIEMDWLPVPSNFERVSPPFAADVSPEAKQPHDLPARLRLGHFGTFGRPIARLLEEILPALLEGLPGIDFLLIGPGGAGFVERLKQRELSHPARLTATGGLNPGEVVRQLLRCDLLIQPFPDGVTTRRGSVMAGLALARPIVTQHGALTESIWPESGAVRLITDPDPRQWLGVVKSLIDSAPERARLAQRGHAFYQARFSLGRTVDALLQQEGSTRPTVNE